MPSKFQLQNQIGDLNERLEELSEQVENQARVQTAALRRIHLLPGNIASLINAQVVEAAALAPGGQGMTYSIGGTLELTIYPYDESFELVDISGRNRPLRLEFGTDEDFDLTKVLAIVGYSELANRSTEGQTVSDWVTQLNGSSAVPA